MIRFLIVTLLAAILLVGSLLMLPHVMSKNANAEISAVKPVVIGDFHTLLPREASPKFQYASLVLNSDVEISPTPHATWTKNFKQKINDVYDQARLLIFASVVNGFANFEPASGDSLPQSTPPSQESLPSSSPEMLEQKERWIADQEQLKVEAVLVPRTMTVISSSHDGRIAELPFSHGDHFKKNDVLVRYACADLEAEADIMAKEQDLSQFKASEAEELFKLDIISGLERKDLNVKNAQTASKKKAVDSRLEDCVIRADFDGRVAKRLANAGEYTRTDRVLMEVVSDESLQAEFIVPSKWLRWINLGAPLTITVSETDATYDAFVSRIYGQVDPVSQSIQMVATLAPYDDNLLPGMSGQAVIDLKRVQSAGIKGYLQLSRAEP